LSGTSKRLPQRPSKPELFTAEYQAEIGTVHEDKPPIAAGPILAKGGCPFFRETARTGGRDQPQGLWMQVGLASTFLDGGREIFRALSKGYKGYTREETDRMFDRKLEEREEKDIGWPSCQKFEEYGSQQCAGCPHKGQIRSPLNLPIARSRPGTGYARTVAG
jgi:hypothetical protein